MRLPDALEALSTDGRSAYVYGQPYETVDGVTIITVSKVRGRVRPSKVDGAPEGEMAIRAKPVGVYVIRDGHTRFHPAMDATAIALLGEVTAQPVR